MKNVFIAKQFSLSTELNWELGPGVKVIFAEYLCTYNDLKVLANDKRGGLKVVPFKKSPFKPFTLRLSNKLVQAPSCKSPKITQRTLFLPFEINNLFPITV
jgi:hypothetical protein